MKLFGSPGRYLQGEGAIEQLGPCAAALGKRAAIVTDPYVAEHFGAQFEASCGKAGVAVLIVKLEGEITRSAIAALVAKTTAFRPDVIIAAGGGKSIDAGKAVCNQLKTRFITVPTVASNDAPTSKNYVIYDESHALVAVEHLPNSPDYVIVDTAVLAKAPRGLLLAGIGDALSKKFEAEQAFAVNGPNMFGAHSTIAAQVLADACFKVLRADAESALATASTGVVTPAFERAVEATLLLSGLGFESGGLSIAHALTRGWPVVPGIAKAQHGLQVAFGLLVQLVLEQRHDDTLSDLEAWFPRLGLPTRLANFGAGETSREILRVAAERCLSAPHARNFGRTLALDEVVDAIEHLRR